MRKDGWSWLASHNRVPPMSLGLKNQIADIATKSIWPRPLRGALWMVLAAFSFAAMTTLIRKLSNDIHPFELAFFRSLFGLLFMLPWFLRAGFGALKTERLGLHGFRALVGLVAMLLWFLALSLMPIAEATALNFTAPLFATAGAAVFLGEKVRARRWGATAVGFVGALIIVRQEGFDLGFATTLVLVASACMSMAVLSVKSLSRTESTNTIVLYGIANDANVFDSSVVILDAPSADRLFVVYCDRTFCHHWSDIDGQCICKRRHLSRSPIRLY